MELLEKVILEKGKVLPGDVLNIGSILNNNIDVKLLAAMAKDVAEHFRDSGVTKVLTVEASGIAFAVLIAEVLGVDAVFAKKSKTSNVSGDVYAAECYSFTHNKTNTLIVPVDYIKKEDKILLADDFLANGKALIALREIVNEAGAKTVGAAIAVEKGYMGGGDKLRNEGLDVYSLAIVDKMEESTILFRK